MRTRVEPKTFFANERTFLQWLQISVLILFTGLSLLGGSSVAPSAAGGSGGTACTGKGCQAGQVLFFLCLSQSRIDCMLPKGCSEYVGVNILPHATSLLTSGWQLNLPGGACRLPGSSLRPSQSCSCCMRCGCTRSAPSRF